MNQDFLSVLMMAALELIEALGLVFKPDCVQRVVQKEGGNIMILGPISSTGVASLIEVPNGMKVLEYLSSLGKDMLYFKFLKDENQI